MFDKLRENIRNGSAYKARVRDDGIFRNYDDFKLPFGAHVPYHRGRVSPFNHANHRTREIRAKEKYADYVNEQIKIAMFANPDASVFLLSIAFDPLCTLLARPV